MNHGFNLVMYTDESLQYDEKVERVSTLVKESHGRGIAVEAEAGEPPNATQARSSENSMTEPDEAARFASATGVDALGVVVGNRHDDAGETVSLDIDLIKRLKKRIKVPPVLHAGSGVEEKSLQEGIKAGIRRVNIGRAIKKPAFHSIMQRVFNTGEEYPGYEVLGSGRKTDLFGEVGSVIYTAVLRKLEIFGSVGRV
ncbi:putative protein YdjI [subsurface metagenome]